MEKRFEEIDNLIKQCNELKDNISANAIFNLNPGVNVPEEIPRTDSRWLKLIDDIETYFRLYPKDRANLKCKDELEKLYNFSRLDHDKRIDIERLDKIILYLGRLKNELKIEQIELAHSASEQKTEAELHINTAATPNYKKVFIVHGHDRELKSEVARLLEKQDIQPIILSEQTSRGRTIIEKIESYSENVGCAICLFTADDEMKDGTKRARQNVIFEAGYFYGKIGRERTIIIADRGTVNLSDLSGVVYVDKSNWKLEVLNELEAIGYDIDRNKLSPVEK